MPQKPKKFEPLPDINTPTDFSSYTFWVKTVQATAIKNLTDVLKNIVHEGTFRVNKNAITCQCIEGSKTCLVNVDLAADNFNEFYCQDRGVHLSLGMDDLDNLMSFITSNDQLTLFQQRNEPDKMVVLIETDTQDARMTKRWRLSLKALDMYEVSMDDTEYMSIITLDSNFFHSMCRGCSRVSDTLIIESLRDRLRIGAAGSTSDGYIEITQTKNCHFKATSDNEYRASFALKFLLLFTKAATLAKNVEMYLARDYPMTLRFMIADLGYLHLSQSAIINLDDNQGSSGDDDDDMADDDAL